MTRPSPPDMPTRPAAAVRAPAAYAALAGLTAIVGGLVLLLLALAPGLDAPRGGSAAREIVRLAQAPFPAGRDGTVAAVLGETERAEDLQADRGGMDAPPGTRPASETAAFRAATAQAPAPFRLSPPERPPRPIACRPIACRPIACRPFACKPFA